MIKVAVTGINPVDNPAPGIGIIKGLKEGLKDIEVVGLAYDAMEPGVFLSELVNRAFLIPYPFEGKEAILERLSYIKSVCGMDVVIPTLDAEYPVFIGISEDLREMGIATFLPTIDQFRLRAKDNLYSMAEKIGIRVPRTEVAYNKDEILEKISLFSFPVVLKGVFYGAKYVYSLSEASQYADELVSKWGYPVIVQEVIRGDELNLVGIGDGRGGYYGMMAMRKMSVTSLGKVWIGVSIKNEELEEMVENFLSHTKWRGPFEFECIFSDGKVYLIEINPRFPAWVYFSVGVGLNLPERLVRAALGEEPTRSSDYEPGRMYIRYVEDFVTDMSVFQKMVTRGER